MMESCEHIMYYEGVMNLSLGDRLLGAIDVWRCKNCPRVCVEEKRYGEMELAPEVGFKDIEPSDAKWAVLVCMKGLEPSWELVSAKPGLPIRHRCLGYLEGELVPREDYSLSGLEEGDKAHQLLLIEDWVNRCAQLRPKEA